MTDCNLNSIHFSPLNSKKIEASFTGGDISSDGGLMLLREVDKKLGLTKRFSQAFNDQRHPGYVLHNSHDLLKQRVYALAAGYEDVNDHDFLRHDLCFQTAIGREVNLASSSTLSRFENAVDRRALVEMNKLLVEHFIENQTKPPTEITLDFDPTDHRIYGKQEGRHYHGYYREHCFLPLHVFSGDYLLVSMLRPSNIDGAKYSGAILRLLVKRFRQTWPNVKIVFRGDCAFGRKRLLYWMEHNNVEYVVGLSGNKRLQVQAKDLLQKVEIQFERSHEDQRLFTEFRYAAGSWKTERRVIVKVEKNILGTNQRFIVTNREGAEAQAIYDDQYCPRGDMENGIKQMKLDLYADRNSCHSFLANQFRVLLSAIAFALLSELRRTHLGSTQFAKAYCQTLRLKLFKIGVVILKNTRRIQFLFSSNHPYQAEFIQAANSLVPT
jgi:hypothetical protein